MCSSVGCLKELRVSEALLLNGASSEAPVPTLKKRTLGALGGAAALLLASDPVGAQGFLQAFRPAAAATRRPQPAFPFPFVQPFFRPYREPARRAKPKPNVPADAAPAMPTEAKPARLTPDAELVANLMKDSTLRRGDIVVFPRDGPRVFKGTAGSSTPTGRATSRICMPPISSAGPHAARF